MQNCAAVVLFITTTTIIIYYTQVNSEKCEIVPRGGDVATFFNWSLRDPINYFEPAGDLKFECQTSRGGSYCVFPQDLRSQGFWGKTEEFVLYHPYIKGFQAGTVPFVDVGVSAEVLRCGVVREDFNYTKNNRNKAPRTKMWEWADVGGAFYAADHFDVDVSSNGGCVGYHCPLAIKIYSRKFTDTRFNGYYIANFPAAYDNDFLYVEETNPFIPTYKHSSRNLYLLPIFQKYLDENGVGEWVVTSTPQNIYKCPGFRMEIKLKAINVVSVYGMGQRYCFSMGSVVKWEQVLVGNNGRELERTDIGMVAVEPLPKQCGMTYRASENTLFNIGLQPFVVEVKIISTRCVGTLISPQHIITLATCFMETGDPFEIGNKLIRRCGYEKGWKNCPRFFHLNVDPESPATKPKPISIQTYKNIHGNYANLEAEWFEIHPLFSGTEFDLAIIALKSVIQRNYLLHPICLPQWSNLDIEGKPTIDRLYKSGQWEKYQILYSLEAMHKDERFSNVWTDVNGPAKFVKCNIPPQQYTSDWRNHCNTKHGYVPPPQLIYDKPVIGDLYGNEPDVFLKGQDGKNKYACEYFYDILEREEQTPLAPAIQRQIRNLQRNQLECFAQITFEFEDDQQEGIRCYERRKRCVELRGWCYAGDEFGFCSEINQLPDTPDYTFPLYEVQTFVMPKDECSNGQVLTSESRICTGHITRSPTEYVFQISQEDYFNTTLKRLEKRVVYEVVEYISGIQRPLVRAPDSSGRVRILTSALEGTCHGSGIPSDLDKGAPTYFRYPIQKASTGQDNEPGNAYAVLYSLQRTTGRSCDFVTYSDTEVLIAMDDVMQWIETVVMEVPQMKTNFDISYAKVLLDLERLKVTTTTRTTELKFTTTDFASKWAHSGFFLGSLNETLAKYPDFHFEYTGPQNVRTKPPIVYIENYDIVGETFFKSSAKFQVVSIFNIVTVFIAPILVEKVVNYQI